MDTLGLRLKKLRSGKKVTQEELAKLFGVDRSTIASWETNRREPDFKTIILLADFFDTTTDYLLGRTDDPNPPKTTEIDEYIYQANDLGQAIIRIMELDHELGFDDQTLIELIKKAKEKYGMPEIKYTEPAAHGPGYPGSGALEDE